MVPATPTLPLLCVVLLYSGGQPAFTIGLCFETWDKPSQTVNPVTPRFLGDCFFAIRLVALPNQYEPTPEIRVFITFLFDLITGQL